MAFSTIYNVFFKRNATFVGTVFAASFVFQTAFDSGVTSWYEAHNKGKLWKDVKLKIGESGDDEDDDDE
ncbi:LAFA_0B03048g1_1 [Lachancea sp. 'fantastica']|nr:LAFA_0B03048g1_1 [Lachancea sp. 'fantastica']